MKELPRKDKALAKTAALLVLRKSMVTLLFARVDFECCGWFGRIYTGSD